MDQHVMSLIKLQGQFRAKLLEELGELGSYQVAADLLHMVATSDVVLPEVREAYDGFGKDEPEQDA